MKVLVTATNYSEYCQSGRKLFEEAGWEIVENRMGRPFTQGELLPLVSDIDAAVVGVDRWDETIFQKAVNLKALARFGVGVDNIDLNAAIRHNIAVYNTPGINSSAVAEQTVALMLSLLRRVPELNRDVRDGKWTRPMFHELKGMTVGLLGFGSVARQVAIRLSGFGPRLLAYDLYPNEEQAEALGVIMTDLSAIFREADIISIHLPASPDTEHLTSSDAIRMMKAGVYLVNTARGKIVDETAVEEAMTEGKIAGFATDVFEQEPVNIRHPLFSHRNYIATPHVSAETYENCEQTGIVTAKEIIGYLSGGKTGHRLV